MPRRSTRTTWLLRLDRETKNYGVYVDDSEETEGVPEFIGRVYLPRNGDECPSLITLVAMPRED